MGLLALLAAAPVTAQEEAGPAGVVSGRVVDEGTDRPVPGARVVLTGVERRTQTGSDGRFVLDGVPVGVYSLEVQAPGFAPFALSDVVVGSGRPYTVEVALEARPIEIEGISTAPSFFRRRSPVATTSVRRLETEELRRSPGAFEDPLRAMAVLPGLAVSGGGRNDLLVRGGAPFENLFLVDGIRVPNINHFGSQGSTGGPVSLVNIDFVRDVTFSSGGFGARYGDRTSSVTDISLREGEAERASGELNLSATGLGVLAEGPVGRGSYLVGLRRSYLDLVFEAAGEPFVPGYWDLTLKVTQELDDRNRLSFLTIGALDRVSFNNETADDRFDNRRILSPSLDQYVSGLVWSRFFDRGTLRTTLGRTLADFETVQRDSLESLPELVRNESTEGRTTLAVDLDWRVGSGLDLRVGWSVEWADELRYDLVVDGAVRRDGAGRPAPLDRDSSLSAWRTSAYAEATFDLTPALRTDVGLRADHYGAVDALRVSPRLGLTLDLDPITSLTLGAGRYVQPPSFIWLLGHPDNARRLAPFHADQVVAGLERLLRPDVRLQVEAFYKRYADYPARVWRPQAVLAPSGFEDATDDIPFGLEPLAAQGEGVSYGGEVFVQKRAGASPWFGLLSLTVGRSEFEGLDGVARAGAYDSPVLATAVLGYRPRGPWEVSGRFRFASGRPTTPFVTSGPDRGRRDFTRYNARRLPDYHALDVRVDRRFSFQGRQLELYLDVQNVYARRNTTRLYWDPRRGEATSASNLTVLPTIGVNLEF